MATPSGLEVLTEHRADAEADVLLHEAVVVEDLRDHRLTLGVGEQQLHAASAARPSRDKCHLADQRSFLGDDMRPIAVVWNREVPKAAASLACTFRGLQS